MGAPAVAPRTGTTIVRPHPAARLGMVAAYLMMATMALREPSQDLGEQLATGFFVVAACLVIAMALRERVELRGETVRVVRLFSEDAFARDDIVSVAKSGGRGRPSHLALRDGSWIESRPLDRDGRPRSRRLPGTVPLGSVMTARRLAAAIGAPLTTYSGKPAGPRFPRDLYPTVYFLIEQRTASGRIRPLVYAYFVLLFTVVALFTALVIDTAT